jgi:hypothetical protein
MTNVGNSVMGRILKIIEDQGAIIEALKEIVLKSQLATPEELGRMIPSQLIKSCQLTKQIRTALQIPRDSRNS